MTSIPCRGRALWGAVTIVLLIAIAPGSGPVPARAQDAARGAALVAEARSALGGEQRLADVRTLQVTGTFRRVVGGNDTEGDFEVFIQLPDNYLRSEKTGTPGQPSTEVIEALVGGEVRDEVLGGGGGAGAGRGGGGPTFGDDGFPTADAGGDPGVGQGDGGGGGAPLAEVAAPGSASGPGRGGRGAGPDAPRETREADVGRLLLMWLLKSDAPLAWIGIAESPDRTADVLEVRYADGRPTRLFIDSSTHMPLMMQWEAAPAQAGGRGGGRRGGGGRGGGGRGGRGGDAGGVSPDGAGARQGGSPPVVTLEMTFFDHRTVDGIRLPYVITRGADGQTTERWTISRYRVNPSLSADTFTQ